MIVALVFAVEPEIRTANVELRPPCYLSREHLPIMTPRAKQSESHSNLDLDLSFFMSSIFGLYQGLVIIYISATQKKRTKKNLQF